jgi:hypothetical protein
LFFKRWRNEVSFVEYYDEHHTAGQDQLHGEKRRRLRSTRKVRISWE